ncbi:carbohydrate ABC transporter permease, partial [Rhizobium leguminosarum]|nr:carbohydrate ABC transporter permease [Rhizobium leguminosarum]
MQAPSSAGGRLALAVRTVAAWGAALLLFFPLAWLFLTAFKT